MYREHMDMDVIVFASAKMAAHVTQRLARVIALLVLEVTCVKMAAQQVISIL